MLICFQHEQNPRENIHAQFLFTTVLLSILQLSITSYILCFRFPRMFVTIYLKRLFSSNCNCWLSFRLLSNYLFLVTSFYELLFHCTPMHSSMKWTPNFESTKTTNCLYKSTKNRGTLVKQRLNMKPHVSQNTM